MQDAVALSTGGPRRMIDLFSIGTEPAKASQGHTHKSAGNGVFASLMAVLAGYRNGEGESAAEEPLLTEATSEDADDSIRPAEGSDIPLDADQPATPGLLGKAGARKPEADDSAHAAVLTGQLPYGTDPVAEHPLQDGNAERTDATARSFDKSGSVAPPADHLSIERAARDDRAGRSVHVALSETTQQYGSDTRLNKAASRGPARVDLLGQGLTGSVADQDPRARGAGPQPGMLTGAAASVVSVPAENADTRAAPTDAAQKAPPARESMERPLFHAPSRVPDAAQPGAEPLPQTDEHAQSHYRPGQDARVQPQSSPAVLLGAAVARMPVQAAEAAAAMPPSAGKSQPPLVDTGRAVFAQPFLQPVSAPPDAAVSVGRVNSPIPVAWPERAPDAQPVGSQPISPHPPKAHASNWLPMPAAQLDAQPLASSTGQTDAVETSAGILKGSPPTIALGDGSLSTTNSAPIAPFSGPGPMDLRQTVELARHTSQQIAATVIDLGKGRFELSLSPAELGKVDMWLQDSENRLTLVVNAERPETLDLIRRHIALLEQELRQMGLGNLSLQLGDGSDAQQDGRPGHARTLGAQGPEAVTPEGPEAPRRTAADRLDLRL